MDLGLEGKTVVVTGGARGIGFACAQGFIAEGARVAIVSRRTESVDAALARLPGALGRAADLSDEPQALAALDWAEAQLGPIDVLVNSAGAARRLPPDQLTPQAYRAAMDAKFFSYVNMIDPLVKRMAARGSGVVVNVIGNGGKAPSPIHVAGGAANAALMLVTAGLAAAHAAAGVRVVALNPGLTRTDRVEEGLGADASLAGISRDEALARAIARIPIGRMAEPGDIADMVLFLASKRAAYVTGVTVTMDGAASPMIV